MKTTSSSTWPRRIGFYLLSLVTLALFGWDDGAIWLIGIVGGIVLLGWWIAGLGWVVVKDEKELARVSPDLEAKPNPTDSIYYDPAYSSLSCNVWHRSDND